LLTVTKKTLGNNKENQICILCIYFTLTNRWSILYYRVN